MGIFHFETVVFDFQLVIGFLVFFSDQGPSSLLTEFDWMVSFMKSSCGCKLHPFHNNGPLWATVSPYDLIAWIDMHCETLNTNVLVVEHAMSGLQSCFKDISK